METLAPPLPARTALDRARRSRDARFDGRFFVGVTSTGVYCRPVCPAPSPRDAHVRYFRTAAAAGDAGFRPCLRCRPEAAPGHPGLARHLGRREARARARPRGRARRGLGRRARRPARHRPAPPPPPVRRPRRRPAARRGEDAPPPLREAADRRDRPVHDRDRVRVGLRQPAPLQRHVPEDLRPRAERAAPAPATGTPLPPTARRRSASRSARRTTSLTCSRFSPRGRSRGSSGWTRPATPARSRSRPGPPWCAWARRRAGTRSSCGCRARPRARCSS